jgi:hypothetical protein
MLMYGILYYIHVEDWDWRSQKGGRARGTMFLNTGLLIIYPPAGALRLTTSVALIQGGPLGPVGSEEAN